MKRLFSALLILMLIFTLCACNKTQTTEKKAQTPETEGISPEEPEDTEGQKKNPNYTTIVGDDPIYPNGFPPQQQQNPTPDPEPEPTPTPTPTPEPTPTPSPDPQTPAKPETIEVTAAQMQQIEEEFLELVNAERARLGLNPLVPNEALDGFAQIRAEELLSLFSHTRPNGEKWSTVIDINAYPYATAGENLVMTSHVGDQAYNPNKDYWTGSPEQISAAAAWIFKLFRESEAHYDNIKNEAFRDSGIGITYVMNDTNSIPIFYLTHLFGCVTE